MTAATSMSHAHTVPRARSRFLKTRCLWSAVHSVCSWCQRTCTECWILSALHELVSPEDVLEPYDVALKDAGRAERRDWSHKVLASLDDQAGLRPGDVVEVHAGSEYRDFGLVEGLRRRSLVVEVPAEGMTLGRQLAFYRDEAD